MSSVCTSSAVKHLPPLIVLMCLSNCLPCCHPPLTQCNNGPAAFWLLGFVLTHPEAMEALQAEIRSLPSEQHGAPIFGLWP